MFPDPAAGNPRTRFLPIFAAILASCAAAAPPASCAPPTNRGLYALGFDSEGTIAQLPYIVGGRILLQWADLETGPGRYDFGELDRHLARYASLGRKTTIQVNGARKPRWLFDRVAVIPGERRQVRDPEGTLQYWDPIFIDAYLAFIKAYGEHVRQSPWRDAVLGIRQNFNAVGTEHGAFAGDDPARELANWHPAPDGHCYDEPWTDDLYRRYRQRVIAAHLDAFGPDVLLFIRNNVFVDNTLTPAQLKLVGHGRLGLFHTSSEPQPRNSEPKYEAFLRYCRTGRALGYTEPFTTVALGATGGSRAQKGPSIFSPCQYNYWRLLLDLHCGISYIALKPADLRRRTDAQFGDAFAFASRYAGYHASPEVSPGAWVALREGDMLKGDYTFLMRRLADRSADEALNNQGPQSQRFGGWARSIAANGRMVFKLDPRFARSLANACLRIVYLDEGTNEFTVTWDDAGHGRRRTIRKDNTGRWRELSIELPSPRFTGALDGGDILLTGAGRTAFHLVEVKRIGE